MQPFRLTVLRLLHLFEAFHRRANTLRQPRCEDERCEQGQQHRRRTQCWNRCHIRPHHSRNEPHRHKRRDHCKGRQNRRVTHLAHRIHSAVIGTFALQQPPTIDVFDHNNGVIHQDPDREDQRKQTNPVNREPHQECRENRKQNNHRNNHQHHNRGTPAQRQPDHHGHSASHHEQLEQQLINLMVRRFAIVPRNFNMNVVRDQTTLQTIYISQNFIGHANPVGATLFGNRNRNRRRTNRRTFTRHMNFFALFTVRAVSRASVVRNDISRVIRALSNKGHITDICRAAVKHTNHQVFNILRCAQERASI